MPEPEPMQMYQIRIRQPVVKALRLLDPIYSVWFGPGYPYGDYVGNACTMRGARRLIRLHRAGKISRPTTIHEERASDAD